MKTSLTSSLLAALVLSIAAPVHASAGEIAVDSVVAKVHANGDSVTRGTSRIMVSMRLGTPNAVLADGSWLYRGYNAHRVSDREDNGPDRRTLAGSGTLIVRFTDGKVASLRLADEPTIIALKKLKDSRSGVGRFAAE